ncbi:MAG TPA: oligosaccharide flippase family protein [Candidatus Bilamarchaeum sp.]|nr:oligosaccharide flippase family protein [Candidatus Bilamarchaeum sp.]
MDGVPEYSKEVARGSFWNLAGSLFFKLISFFYVVILARAASADDIGIFYLSLSIITLVGVVSDLGLPGAMQRYVPFYEGSGRRDEINRMLSLCFRIVFVLSMVFSAAAFLSADLIGGIYQNAKLADAIRVISIFIVVQNVFRISYFFLQGLSDMKSMQLLNNVQNIAKLALTLLFFHFFGPTALSISVAFTLSHVIGILLTYPRIKSVSDSLPKAAAHGAAGFIHEVLPFAFTLTLVNSTWVIVSSSDKAILGYLVPPASAPEQVAMYTIASTLAGVLFIFPNSIETIFLPLLSKFVGKGDMDKVREMTEDSTRWAMLITFPVAMALAVFSPELLAAFYGAAYTGGSLSMMILVAGIAVKAASSMLFLALAALRLVRLELKLSLLAAMLNVALNVFLIPRLGMEGAALGTALSFAALACALAYYSMKTFGFRLRGEFFRIILCGVAASVLLFALRTPLLSLMGPGGFASDEPLLKAAAFAYLGALCALSLALFLLFTILLRCYSRHDVSLFEGVLARLPLPTPLKGIALKTASFGVYDRK